MAKQVDVMDAMEGKGWMRLVDIINIIGRDQEPGCFATMMALHRKGAVEFKGIHRERRWRMVKRVEVGPKLTSRRNREIRGGWPRTTNRCESEITEIYDDRTYDDMACTHEAGGPCVACEFDAYYRYKRGENG